LTIVSCGFVYVGVVCTLVLGDLWRPQDVWVTPIDTLSTYSSGVLRKFTAPTLESAERLRHLSVILLEP